MCRSACVKQHSHICLVANTVRMTTTMQAHMTGAQNRQAERKSPGFMDKLTLALKTSRRYIWMGHYSQLLPMRRLCRQHFGFTSSTSKRRTYSRIASTGAMSCS